MNEQSFGIHLILDCYKCSPEKLNDPVFLSKMLNNLVEELEMKKISEPLVLEYEGETKKDKGGYSGFVMIAESHISFHSFPSNKGFVTMDLYTCKEFNVNKAINFIVKELKAEKWNPTVIERGLGFQD